LLCVIVHRDVPLPRVLQQPAINFVYTIKLARQALVEHSSSTHQAHVKHLSYTHQSLIKHLSSRFKSINCNDIARGAFISHSSSSHQAGLTRACRSSSMNACNIKHVSLLKSLKLLRQQSSSTYQATSSRPTHQTSSTCDTLCGRQLTLLTASMRCHSNSRRST